MLGFDVKMYEDMIQGSDIWESLAVGSNHDLYSAPVTAVMYVISCYIGPCYKHTPLYIDGLVQEDVTPLLTHWSYVFLALTHRYINEMSCHWYT